MILDILLVSMKYINMTMRIEGVVFKHNLINFLFNDVIILKTLNENFHWDQHKIEKNDPFLSHLEEN